MITALIDGDWILYAAGFAGQRTMCVYVDRPSCVVVFGDNMTECKKELASIVDEGGEPIHDFDSKNLFYRETLDPESHFYHSAKKMIESQCNKIAKKFGEDVTPIIMTEGDGNFRSRLATIRPYKGSRHVHAKPLMYNNIRQYLLEAWDAEVIFDQETDDAMAIRQTELHAAGKKSVIVGVDKDMLQVPGWHLNPKKGFKRITRAEGEARLYVQAAMGDSVDNIAGCYKVGPAKAKEVFADLDMSEEDKWDALVKLYNNSIAKSGDVYGGLDGTQAALENMRLVYLRRFERELWMPPGVRK